MNKKKETFPVILYGYMEMGDRHEWFMPSQVQLGSKIRQRIGLHIIFFHIYFPWVDLIIPKVEDGSYKKMKTSKALSSAMFVKYKVNYKVLLIFENL